MTRTNFCKAGKISTVATVIDAATTRTHNVAAVVAMRIVNKSCPPMHRGSVNHFHAIKFHHVPHLHFMHGRKAQALHQRSTPRRHDDTIARLQNLEALLVHVIVMRMTYEH